MVWPVCVRGMGIGMPLLGALLVGDAVGRLGELGVGRVLVGLAVAELLGEPVGAVVFSLEGDGELVGLAESVPGAPEVGGAVSVGHELVPPAG